MVLCYVSRENWYFYSSIRDEMMKRERWIENVKFHLPYLFLIKTNNITFIIIKNKYSNKF